MLHIVHAILTFLSVACCAIGLALGGDYGWFVMKLPTISTRYELGLFSTCTIVNGVRNCAGVSWTASSCTSAKTASDRWIGLQVCSIVAGAVHFVLIFTVLSTTPGVKVIRILMSLVGFLAWAGCLALFFVITLYWHGCKKSLCSTITTTLTCTHTFAAPLWVMVGGAACSLLCFVFSFLAPSQPAAATPAETEPTNERDNAPPTAVPISSPPPAASRTNSKQEQKPVSTRNAEKEPEKAPEKRAPPNGPPTSPKPAAANADPNKNPELPEGDWVFDAESGMYWSDQNYMFLHLESGQFYDPETGLWYSSELDEWYNPDEQEDIKQS